MDSMVSILTGELALLHGASRSLTNLGEYREYPGAPDRGGKPDDTANMVLLFASIREAFNRSGRDFELTFTIPASYWYLRWFDMPGLMEYADWTNLVCHRCSYCLLPL